MGLLDGENAYFLPCSCEREHSKCALERHSPPHTHTPVLGLDVEGMTGRCAELLMRGFLGGIACILPTTQTPVSNVTFELCLSSAPDPWDLVPIRGRREALILREYRGSPVMCGLPELQGLGKLHQAGWVAEADPVIKQEPSNTQVPKN